MTKSDNPSDYIPVDDAEARKMLRLAIGLHINSLPQLKGKGARTNLNMDFVTAHFADKVFDTLMSNAKLFRGPPSSVPSMGTRSKD